MFWLVKAWWVACGAAFALGCKQDVPSRVLLETPDLVLSADPVKALVWLWHDTQQKQPGSGKYDYSVQPPDLAQVSAQGQVSCSRSGDGQVHVSVAGIEASAPLRCRLVDHIEAKDVGRIELSAGAVKLDVAAYTKDGQRLEDVPVTYTTPNTSVVRAARGTLEPLQVGRANVTVRAGNAEKSFEVEVVRRIVQAPLPMNDNTRMHFSLEPGTYELVVKLESAKRMQIEWRSAPYCNASAVAEEHKSTCVLRAKGGVVFDSPAYLDHGSKEITSAGVSLHEVPLR
jgi:hypothetical protein